MIRAALAGAVAALALSGCATIDGHRMSSLRDLRLAQTDPTAAKDRIYAFRGEVLTAESAPGLSALQINVRGDNPLSDGSEVLAVVWPTPLTEMDIARRDEITVVGQIVGSVSGKNALGGPVSVMTLKAFALTNAAGKTWTINSQREVYERWLKGVPQDGAKP